MKKASIRSLGIGLFIAGTVFQIQHLTQADTITSKHTINEDAYEKSQTELKLVKQQLARLQLDLKNAQNEHVTPEKKDENANNLVTKSFLVILPGMNSEQISATLVRAGVIESNKEFQDYMQSNSLTGLIQIGEYELNSSMTIEEIATIITTQ